MTALPEGMDPLAALKAIQSNFVDQSLVCLQAIWQKMQDDARAGGCEDDAMAVLRDAYEMGYLIGRKEAERESLISGR